MGQDFVALANETKKEYIKPYVGFTSSVFALMNDWLISKSTLYLVTSSHNSFKPRGEFSESLIGSWSNSELKWIGDYDSLWDQRPRMKGWVDITFDAYIMLLEYGYDEAFAAFEDLKINYKKITFLGDAYESTGSGLLNMYLEERLGVDWLSWYQFAKSSPGEYHSISDWPIIR